jgi:hypothetical protein
MKIRGNKLYRISISSNLETTIHRNDAKGSLPLRLSFFAAAAATPQEQQRQQRQQQQQYQQAAV